MMPWWLQYLKALAVVAIPAVGAWLAWQQVQIARVKLQHDLYDRRFRVFDAARRFVANIRSNGTTTDEDVRAFIVGTGDAVFLFDYALAKYLDEMRSRASEMQSRNAFLDDRSLLPPLSPARVEATKIVSEHQSWFGEQMTAGLIRKFEPFLKLDKRRPHGTGRRCPAQKPWLAEGVSRSTWYRRRKELWIRRFAWTMQTRCPHAHSRSSNKRLDF
jgi:hypothetical protein